MVARGSAAQPLETDQTLSRILKGCVIGMEEVTTIDLSHPSGMRSRLGTVPGAALRLPLATFCSPLRGEK